MKSRALFILIGMIFVGCVVKHTTPGGNNVHVITSPFEEARAKRVARQFFLAYMEPKESRAMSVADFKCTDAKISADFDEWTVTFSYMRDPFNVVVKVSGNLETACVYEENEGSGDRPAIDGDGDQCVKRTLAVFRWMLAEQSKQHLR
jgi:hypothetical protein